jgi:hypothetical protein
VLAWHEHERAMSDAIRAGGDDGREHETVSELN